MRRTTWTAAGLTAILAGSAWLLAGGASSSPVAGEAPSGAAAGGAAGGSRSGLRPLSAREFELLQQAALFGEEDVRYLRMSREVLAPHVSELLDVWYGFVGKTPQLAQYFADANTGKPDARYLAAVRERFQRWVLETAEARFDEAWLARQLEIGLRHHRAGKNRTDNVNSAPIVHYRYLPALAIPITTTLKPFLARGGHTPEEVEKMHAAWEKAVQLQVILWSQPYVVEGDF